jgi:hypothetical protein
MDVALFILWSKYRGTTVLDIHFLLLDPSLLATIIHTP